MSISIFDLFSIGLGPSSSHTVGPMRAAAKYISHLKQKGLFSSVASVSVDLYGSLALTGEGHSTALAIMIGLSGFLPEEIEPEEVVLLLQTIREKGTLLLSREKEIPFFEDQDILFHKEKFLPYHPNGMRFRALDSLGKEIDSMIYYSVGGGFIVDHAFAMQDKELGQAGKTLKIPFKTAAELLDACDVHNMTIDEIVMENELAFRTKEGVKQGILRIWGVMKACTERGLMQEGELPGGLRVQRRAANLYRKLKERKEQKPSDAMEWLSVWALAVNEENAAGGRVVTAPTNGASGVIPSVLHYLIHLTDKGSDEAIIRFMLTAGAIGILYKEGASISAAEMGCMGEVGVACSMAAAGLTAALGGTTAQIENAAEIGMEHNLGLTCDPIKGLVQIPCIERNTMGAIKAVNAALLSLASDGKHRVSLDQVINTMRQTGRDMQSIYKETSLGGLAVNVPEC